MKNRRNKNGLGRSSCLDSAIYKPFCQDWWNWVWSIFGCISMWYRMVCLFDVVAVVCALLGEKDLQSKLSYLRAEHPGAGAEGWGLGVGEGAILGGHLPLCNVGWYCKTLFSGHGMTIAILKLEELWLFPHRLGPTVFHYEEAVGHE